MGIFDKFLGKTKNQKGKLEPPLLEEQYHGLIGLEFGMYLTWVEDTTNKSIMGKELEKRIKMFLQKEKKLKRIKAFNKTDIMYINLTILGQAISFGIFVWFCMRYVWPPLIKVLEERAETIADGLAAAERGAKELEDAKGKVELLLSEGREKALEFVNQAQRRAEEIVEAAKSEALLEADKIKSAAQTEMDQERNRAREELRQEVADLVIMGTEKILAREVDEKSHREILKQISSDM